MHEQRARLRLISLAWALTAACSAGLVAWLGAPLAVVLQAPDPGQALPVVASGPLASLEPALRAGGCGFFYGLLAFHLQRVDPDDSHLQAGLVGAVCAIRSLAAPPALSLLPLAGSWLVLWLPLVAAALVLQTVQRCWSAVGPARATASPPPSGAPPDR